MINGLFRKDRSRQTGCGEVWFLRVLSLASCAVASKVFYMRYFGKSLGKESLDTYLVSFVLGIGVFIGLRYSIDIVFNYKEHKLLSILIIGCSILAVVTEFFMGNDAMDTSLNTDFNKELQIAYDKIDKSAELLNFQATSVSLANKIKDLAEEDSLLKAQGSRKRHRSEMKDYTETKARNDSLYLAIRSSRRLEAEALIAPKYKGEDAKGRTVIDKYPSVIVTLVTLILLASTRYCEQKYKAYAVIQSAQTPEQTQRTMVKFSKESEKIERDKVDLTVESTSEIQLDGLEKKILEIVLSQPNISYTQLSKMAGAPRSTCLNKRRMLEAKGYLKSPIEIEKAKAEIIS